MNVYVVTGNCNGNITGEESEIIGAFQNENDAILEGEAWVFPITKEYNPFYTIHEMELR